MKYFNEKNNLIWTHYVVHIYFLIYVIHGKMNLKIVSSFSSSPAILSITGGTQTSFFPWISTLILRMFDLLLSGEHSSSSCSIGLSSNEKFL